MEYHEAKSLNHPEHIRRIYRLGRKDSQRDLREDEISLMKPLMGLEDFSFYLQKISVTFAFLGVENKEKGIIYPQHHPKYNIDEDILPIGTPLHVAVVLEYLKGQ